MMSDDSHELSEMADAAIEVEILQSTQGFESKISQIVDRNGLNLLSTWTLVKIKSVVAEYRKSQRPK